jgi:hypothetical protein
MNQNRIFREERPGERKTISTLLLTGYFVTVSFMGYMAFFLNIQLTQMDRITSKMNVETLTVEQFNLLKTRVIRATVQIRQEVIWLAIIGTVVSIMGGMYTYNLVVKPLRKLVAYTEDGGVTSAPEIKTNNEIKQLTTAIQEIRQIQPAANPEL